MKDKESYITMQSNEMIDSTQEVTRKFLSYLNENQNMCLTFKSQKKLDDSQLLAIKKFEETIDNVIPDFIETSSKKMKYRSDLIQQRLNRYCPAPRGDLKAYIDCNETATRAGIITQLELESNQYKKSTLEVIGSALKIYKCIIEKKAVTASSVDDLNNKISAFIELMKKRDESVQNTASQFLN